MHDAIILSTTTITPRLLALAAEVNQESSGSLVFTGIIDSNRPSESLACHRAADPHGTESVL